jgi:hypothetical protein
MSNLGILPWICTCDWRRKYHSCELSQQICENHRVPYYGQLRSTPGSGLYSCAEYPQQLWSHRRDRWSDFHQLRYKGNHQNHRYFHLSRTQEPDHKFPMSRGCKFNLHHSHPFFFVLLFVIHNDIIDVLR